MKHPIKFIFPLLILLFFITCEKEEQLFLENSDETLTYKVNSVDDFNSSDVSSARDGGRAPFHFITSQTIVDPFTSGSPQEAYNMWLQDSTTYEKVSDPNVAAWGGNFDKYNISYYFPDTIIRYYDEYAPTYAGYRYTYIPPAFNAVFDLDKTNLNRSVKLIRNLRFETYVDIKCGKTKRRYQYLHYFNGNIVGTNSIDGDRCNSNIFSFKHVL